MSKILLIDDDETLSDSIGVMLEREQFTPILAGDAETGFQKALSLKPQLMLVDLRLPGMGGAVWPGLQPLAVQWRFANRSTPLCAGD